MPENPVNPTGGIPPMQLRRALGLPDARWEPVFVPREFELVQAMVPVEAMPVVERAAVEVYRVAGQPPHPDRGIAMGAVLEALAADFLAGRALEVVARNLHGT